MKLNELGGVPGERKTRRRVGRGIGSGRGKTSGRGHKGQKSRAGVAIKGFEGGQMPIYRRLPRRGFHNIFAKRFEPVNLDRLQGAVDAKKLDPSKPIGVEELRLAGLVRGNRDGVRLLARGRLAAALTLEVDGASKAALAAVEKAGGKLVLSGIEAPAKPARKSTPQAGAPETSEE